MKNIGLFVNLVAISIILIGQTGFCQTGNNKVSIKDAQKTGLNFCTNQFTKQELSKRNKINNKHKWK